MSDLGNLIRSAGIFQKVRVKSVLESLVWPMALVCLFVFAIVNEKPQAWVIIVSFVLLALLVLTIVGSYIFLLFNDRDSLRSEEYLLKRYQMEMMGTKDKPISQETLDAQEVVKGPVRRLVRARRLR